MFVDEGMGLAKNYEKEGNSLAADRNESLLQIYSKEPDSINESLAIIKEISQKHNINFKQIEELLKNRDKYIAVPVSIFRSSLLGPLEALVRYLKDVMDYNFSKIAKLLKRDETTIWMTYHNSLEKSKTLVLDLEMKDVDFKGMNVKREELIVPLSVFFSRQISILEALCLYLKENFGLNYHDIGLLLERDERTVWTVVSRARKKLANG
jgi:hypothetical protein